MVGTKEQSEEKVNAGEKGKEKENKHEKSTSARRDFTYLLKYSGKHEENSNW